MNNLGKFLIGAAATVVGVIVVKKVVDHTKEKKYSKVKTPNQESKSAEETAEDPSLKEKIMNGAAEKVTKILCWMSDHEQETKGIVLAFSLGAAAVDFSTSMYKHHSSKKMAKQTEEILKVVNEIRSNSDDSFDAGYVTGSNKMFDEALYQMRQTIEKGDSIFRFIDTDGSVIGQFHVSEVAA